MDLSIEYIAGLFDGEGSVGIYPSKTGTSRSVKFLAQFTQLWHPESEKVWREMNTRWGGHLATFINLSGKPSVNWQLNGDQAYKFLSDIRPHTRLKSDQIDLVVSWWDSREVPTRSPSGQMQPRSDESWAQILGTAATLKSLKHPHPSDLILKNRAL